MISVLILTKNEERDLPRCLQSVMWSDDVHVYDSHSTDGTLEIARRFGCNVTQRKFDNWSSHQNWGLSNIRFKYNWVLYIDADETVSGLLRRAAIEAVQSLSDGTISAFRVQRRDFFSDGTWLRHAQISPYFVRLFKPKKMRYERLVNPISIVDGAVADVNGYIDHYPFSKGIGFWLERHIRYADLEAQTILQRRSDSVGPSLTKALFSRDFSERRANQKELFYCLPFRPFVKLCYMVVFRRAFMDGRAGITYAALQSIYEYVITLKQREYERLNDSAK